MANIAGLMAMIVACMCASPSAAFMEWMYHFSTYEEEVHAEASSCSAEKGHASTDPTTSSKTNARANVIRSHFDRKANITLSLLLACPELPEFNAAQLASAIDSHEDFEKPDGLNAEIVLENGSPHLHLKHGSAKEKWVVNYTSYATMKQPEKDCLLDAVKKEIIIQKEKHFHNRSVILKVFGSHFGDFPSATYNISIRNMSGMRLGAEIGKKSAKIFSINSNGLLPEWNAKAGPRKVNPGDSIIAANDVTSDVVSYLKLGHKVLNLTLSRSLKTKSVSHGPKKLLEYLATAVDAADSCKIFLQSLMTRYEHTFEALEHEGINIEEALLSTWNPMAMQRPAWFLTYLTSCSKKGIEAEDDISQEEMHSEKANLAFMWMRLHAEVDTEFFAPTSADM